MSEHTVSDRIRTFVSTLSPGVRWTILGLVIGAVGLVIQAIAAPEYFHGFPPGVIWVGAAGLIVLLDRRSPWSPLSAMLLALFIVLGGLAGGDLGRNLGSSNLALVIGTATMVLGLGISVLAGTVAIWQDSRARTGRQIMPYRRENPRQLAVLISAGGMFLAGFADAAPEGWHWDGPGPIMFWALGLLVLFVPGRHIMMLGTLLSAVFIYGAFDSPQSMHHLTTPSQTTEFVWAIVQLIGYTVATLAGAVACLPSRTALRQHVQHA